MIHVEGIPESQKVTRDSVEQGQRSRRQQVAFSVQA